MSEKLSIGLKREVEEFKNYHVNSSGEFSAFTRDRYGSLLHELMHFMNAIDSFDSQEKSEKIYVRNEETNIIKNTGVVSKLKFSKEDIYPKEQKKKSEEEEEREESDKELDDEKLKDIRDELEEVLRNLYDTGAETWTMYGIFICQDKQNPGKYEFYYDPINEAVADSECKIINGKKRQVVRTTHTEVIREEHIDPDDETSSLAIKVLDKKIGIYRFYFDKGKKLRELVDKEDN